MGEVLSALLDRRGLGRASRGAMAVLRWPEFAGPTIAAHSRARNVRRGILTVTVDSNIWATELTMHIPLFMDRISSALGEGTITGIRFLAGPQEARASGSASGVEGSGPLPPGAARPNRYDLALIPLLPEEQDRVRSLAAQTKDPELATATRRWLTLTLKARRWMGGGPTGKGPARGELREGS